ncbi:intercellular adhesion molecule 1 [Cynocephalus volans]|uniref:intercellular adhesion molecule 1 n=1 Tax=Cynocephalus volans TaxID=110931 RepID=UPI002FC7F7A1
MDPSGSLPALLVLIGALLPVSGGAQVSVFPPEAILLRGGSVQVNCSASCNQSAIFGLETELTKEEVDQGYNWKLYKLIDVQEDSTLHCYSTCHNKQTMASTSLIVYGFPESVELAPLPSWHPVGENFTLSCQVAGGEPRAHLTVVLLRGEEELSRQPAVGKPTNVTVTATVLAGRGDHGANFSCRTELDLKPLGLELFQNTSAPRQLQTFVLPMTPPHLDTARVLEVGTKLTVLCSLDGLFPASEAQVHLALGDQRLNPKITYNKDFLVAMASVKGKAEDEGNQQLKCVVTLGTQSQQTGQPVTIYSFPAPNLTLSEPEVSEGTEVMVECEAHAGAVVTLSGAPAGPPSSRAQMLLNATAEDNGRNFSCSAALEVAGQVLHKNQTRGLSVLYGPRLDERDCQGNWTWQEGSQQTLKCKAWGNPSPQLNCQRKRDGALLRIWDPILVKRDLVGTYRCRAVSTRGEVTRDVFINVLYQQNNIVIITVVASIVIVATVTTAIFLYNRQRKIRKYKLQEAEKGTTMKKLNTQATPP